MSFTKKKICFALFFGNRGFFPGELIASAREEMKRALSKSGYDYICMPEKKTKYGAVETIAEGRIYAEFLKENEGNYDGIILSLPNFGDENGAVAALKDAKAPILVQAYPDEIGLMDFSHRRDAMCGKFAICNLLRQADIPFTLTKKFVVSPSDASFSEDVERFAAICRIVKGMKSFNIGAIGARTTAFKTVRVDETALQKKGINLETIDLADFFLRVDKISDERTEEKKKEILAITVYKGYPEEKLNTMARVQAALEDTVKEYNLDAVAIRCWNEFQMRYGIAPCVSLCLLNERGISAACEVDVTNAIMMRAISLASDAPSMLLDYNNNYADASDKAIVFHCGPVAPSMLKGKGEIIEYLMFKKSFGAGTGVGVNKGEIKEGDITFGSVKTENGKVYAFVSEASFTSDKIEPEFFGTGKVLRKTDVNALSNYMAENGYKHHLAITYGKVSEAVKEAFDKYLGFECEIV